MYIIYLTNSQIGLTPTPNTMDSVTGSQHMLSLSGIEPMTSYIDGQPKPFPRHSINRQGIMGRPRGHTFQQRSVLKM